MLLFRSAFLKEICGQFPENKFLSNGGKYECESISRIILENPIEKYHFPNTDYTRFRWDLSSILIMIWSSSTMI